ncbi:MAG TPA: response regulator transcription factor [Virgibacillus sp.]|nr:response regulator transcription factor [Virgibacillus sp.]
MTHIMLVDDHPMALEGMKEILSEAATFKVVGEATTGIEAIEKIGNLLPDVILMDINLPDMNGMETTRLIKDKYPTVKIIMVTVSDNIVDLFESIKCGAQGYLLKNMNHDSWIPYIQSIIHEDTQIDDVFATNMLKEFYSHQSVDYHKQDELTYREQEILTWVAKGLTNKEISMQLEISEYTVKNHLKSIFQKLQLNNRVQLAHYAFKNGYLDETKLLS